MIQNTAAVIEVLYTWEEWVAIRSRTIPTTVALCLLCYPFGCVLWRWHPAGGTAGGKRICASGSGPSSSDSAGPLAGAAGRVGSYS
jgi:hypothetical protein